MIAPMIGGGMAPGGIPTNTMRTQMGPPMGAPAAPPAGHLATPPPMGAPPMRGSLAPMMGGGGGGMLPPPTNSGVPIPQRPFAHIGNPRTSNPIATPTL